MGYNLEANQELTEIWEMALTELGLNPEHRIRISLETAQPFSLKMSLNRHRREMVSRLQKDYLSEAGQKNCEEEPINEIIRDYYNIVVSIEGDGVVLHTKSKKFKVSIEGD